MELLNFNSLLAQVHKTPAARRMAVAGAADSHVIKSILAAKKDRIAVPVLVGDAERIKRILLDLGENVTEFYVINNLPGKNEAETAVELLKSGDADFLMKGMLETSTFLRPVVKAENGLRTGRTMSHVAFHHLPSYHKMIVITDGGMCTYPDVNVKKEIVLNVVDMLCRIGYQLPKIACICCKETVDHKMPETMDGLALKQACTLGELGECFVEGPISYDIAMSAEIAAIKKFDCPYTGDFDVLLVPNIHAGNILSKSWIINSSATMAGIIAGARVPIVLTSRGSSPREKYLSIALASLVSAGEY